MEINSYERDLASIARAYGTVYDCVKGEVAFTELKAPDDFVLETGYGDELRYYMWRKKGGIWEYAPGTSTIAKEGLPTSEELILWRIRQGIEQGKILLEDAARVGTAVHKALQDAVDGATISLTDRERKERWCIISGVNFLIDLQPRNIQTEQIVGYDNVHYIFGRQIRVLYAGQTDLICEIFNPKIEKWETWVIDYKTSKEAHLSHRVQVLGYAQAAVASGRIDHYDRVGILLLGKQTRRGYQLVDATITGAKDWKLSFNDFLATYYHFLLFNGGRFVLPTYKVYPLTLKLNTNNEPDDNNDQKDPAKNENKASGDAARKANAPATHSKGKGRKSRSVPQTKSKKVKE